MNRFHVYSYTWQRRLQWTSRPSRPFFCPSNHLQEYFTMGWSSSLLQYVCPRYRMHLYCMVHPKRQMGSSGYLIFLRSKLIARKLRWTMLTPGEEQWVLFYFIKNVKAIFLIWLLTRFTKRADTVWILTSVFGVEMSLSGSVSGFIVTVCCAWMV